MQKSLRYTVFKTRWGYFGLSGIGYALWRTCLPLADPEKVKLELLKNRPVANQKTSIEFDKNLFRSLQEQIIAYFEGACIDFSKDIPAELAGYSLFTCSVLTACRDIKFGQRISYSSLAESLGQSTAARAVGNALAKNPVPLLIPCHRVIRSDGKIGGFSALGGKGLKAKLLKHEQASL
jgi:methylated-DNA-[protein]-cysteine S-methyltransferase